jgi:FkbM family methyltransferase
MDAQHPLDVLLRELAPSDIRCVFDLGSGSGSTALHLHRALPNARVFAFECDTRAIDGCRAALRDTSVTLVPLAVGDTTATLSLHLGSTNAVAASLLPPATARVAHCALVQCTRLDSWCSSNGVWPDVVWCDVEADPLAPLRGLGALLTSVLGIYLPILYRPLYVGQPSLADIETFLRAGGFRRLDHVQSLSGHWGYAVYVNARIPRRTGLSTQTPAADRRPFARGGLGDLLQYVTAARQARSIRAYSHYSGARDFFAHLGVDAEHIPFEANTTFLSWADAGTELARDYFPSLPVPPPAIPLPMEKKGILGLHPMGSGYSNTFAQRFQAPAKWMSPEFITALFEAVQDRFAHILVFCSPNEQHLIPEMLGSLSSRSTTIAMPNVWASLSMVQLCSAVVAVDSSIKTIASMLRIPTVTLVGDYEEPFRDRHFLQPYVRAGIMKTLRYSVLSRKEAAVAALLLLNLTSPNTTTS